MEKMTVIQVDFENGFQTLVPGSVPWSHGLFMSSVWSAIAVGIALLFLRDRCASGMVGLVAFSHWILDFLVHPPDLPTFFDTSRALGLDLWTTGPGFILNIILEFTLLIGAIAIYVLWRRKT